MRMPSWWTAADELPIVVIKRPGHLILCCILSSSLRSLCGPSRAAKEIVAPDQTRVKGANVQSNVQFCRQAIHGGCISGAYMEARRVESLEASQKQPKHLADTHHSGRVLPMDLPAGGFEIRSKFRRRRIPGRPMLNPAANTFTCGGVGDTLGIRVLGLAIADPAHLYL